VGGVLRPDSNRPSVPEANGPSAGGDPLRILVVGQRMLPFRHAGDKNFWFDVLRRFRGAGHEVEVLSVMKEDASASNFPIHRVRPVPLYFRPDPRFNQEFEFLGATSNYPSKTVSLPRIGQAIRRIRRDFHPDVIHFADNYGPAMLGLRAACGRAPMAISAPTYQADRPFYDLFLLASFRTFNAVVPFSDAYRRRLEELRVPRERIRRIRWGIDVDKFTPLTPAERAAARAQLGLDASRIVVLWTGFTQQTNERDFHDALLAASTTLHQKSSRFVFLFCFKPEHFNPSYLAFERVGLRILDTAEAFHAARASADVLLAPIRETRSTAAPPLVWLECLAMGTPILTTDIPGADEAVVADRSGFRVRSTKEASERLLQMEADPELLPRLRVGARQVAVERYSVDIAAREYAELWSQLAGNPKALPGASVHPSPNRDQSTRG